MDGGSSPAPNGHPVPNGSPPAVSVIILAHDRREYLRSAIESVLQQDVGRSSYELIVVKNYTDAALDEFAARAGATVILCTAVPGAAKIAAAFRQSHGRVICILDDDDLLEPSRLRKVVAAFEEDSNLGFYRNLFTYISENGGPLPRSAVPMLGLRSVPQTPRLYIPDAQKAAEVSRLAFTYPDFNVSSSAMRRELLTSVLPDLDRMQLTVDTLVFFEALSSHWSLLLDDQFLTRYRVHGANSSLAGGGEPAERLNRLIGFARITLSDYEVVRERVAASGRSFALRQIEARILVNRLTLASRKLDSKRGEFLRLLAQVPRYGNTFPVRESFRTVGGAFVFLLSPSLGRALYQNQMSVR